MLSAIAQYRDYDEPEQCAGAVGGIAIHSVPRAATPFRSTNVVHSLGDAKLILVSSSPSFAMVETGPDTALVQVPIAGHDSYVVNGCALRRGTYSLYSPGAAFERASAEPTRTALLMMSPQVAQAALPGAAAEALARQRAATLRQGETSIWTRLSALVLEAARQPAAAGTEVRRGLRAAVFQAFGDLLMQSGQGEAGHARRHAPARQRIVRRADAFLRESVARPIYTDELCVALGISPAALSAAFHATFGISPHRFLKLRRLAMVRTALRRGVVEPALVKSIALAHGFWHLGQFAHDYRATYGEKPSETLIAARGADARLLALVS